MSGMALTGFGWAAGASCFPEWHVLLKVTSVLVF